MHTAFQKLKENGYVEVDTHLCELAKKGDIDGIEGLDLDEPTQLILYDLAITAGHTKILQKLSSETKNQLLMLNGYDGNIHNIRALLNYHQFMHTNSILDAFHMAAAYGHVEVVRVLIQTFKRVITQAEINRAVQKAIEGEELEIVKLLYTNDQFPLLYEEELPNFARLILPSKEPSSNKQDARYTQKSFTHTTIHNLAGYEKGIDPALTLGYPEGKPLSLADGTPIGYVAYVPQQVKAVCVEVYGGGGELYTPNMYNEMLDYIIRQDIAVVRLNLVDLLKLGETYQLEMPRELHEKVQESIHHAFNTLKQSPLSLHAGLAQLKEKPFFMFGQSFGGTIAVRHAQIHPHTFEGYISLNGDLSIVKSIETQKFYPDETTQGVLDAQHWLCPTFGVQTLEDPILLLQNLYDNNVTLSVAADFMKKAKDAGKEDLIRLLGTEYCGAVVADQLWNTGHSIPDDEKTFERILSVITSFMLKGPSLVPAVTKWRAGKYEVSSHQDNPIANLEDVFIAKAFSLYQEVPEKKVTIDKISPRDIVSKSISRREKAWQFYYLPIYRVLYYIDKLKNNPKEWEQYVKAHKTRAWVLDKDAVDSAFKAHLTGFVKYIKERYGIDSLDTKMLLQNKALQETFKDLLLHPSEMDQDTYLYLLTNLLIAKPLLVEKETKSLIEHSAQLAQLNEVQQRFRNEIIKYKANIRAVWKEAAKKEKALNRVEERQSAYAKMDDLQIFRDAADHGDLKTINSMLDDPLLRIPDYIIEDAFSSAVFYNKKIVVMHLLKRCSDAIGRRQKVESLNLAARYKHDDMINLLLNNYGNKLKEYELIQAIGPTRAKAYLKEIKPAKKWPTVIPEVREQSQENQPPSQDKTTESRPLAQTPQKQLQQTLPTSNPAIVRPIPVRPPKK